MEEVYFRYNPWWEEEYILKGIIQRPAYYHTLERGLSSKSILFLTGIRRVGKTTLLKLFIQHLIEKGVPPTRIFYVSLDDYLLSKKNILEIVDEYRRMHRISFKEKVFLFLDEVAYQKDFELQLKTLHDSQNVKIYASSSSASILRTRKPHLTGRSMIVEVLPLDFREYLTFRGISIPPSDTHLLEAYFEEYLKHGGMPEYVLSGDSEYLRELVDDIIHKDIAALHNVRSLHVLKEFFLLLMERAGKVSSINKIAKILKISPDSAGRYLQMFIDTFLIYSMPRCGTTNERILSPRKIYCVDLGIRVLFTGFRDKGSLFENYVYLKLKEKQNRRVKEVRAKKKLVLYGIRELERAF